MNIRPPQHGCFGRKFTDPHRCYCRIRQRFDCFRYWKAEDKCTFHSTIHESESEALLSGGQIISRIIFSIHFSRHLCGWGSWTSSRLISMKICILASPIHYWIVRMVITSLCISTFTISTLCEKIVHYIWENGRNMQGSISPLII